MKEALDPHILQQIRTLLRRDLKLGAEEPLPEEMPFFGGDVDLDSLDMLLLVTSIERQFGVRIPSEAVGKEVFQSVASLTRYVQEHRGAAPIKPVAAPPPTDWLASLPHGKEFRFVTKVVDVRPGESANGIWSVLGNESFFAGHFPGNPIVPGVLIAEALAQISGFAGPANSGSQGKLAHVDIRFEQSVAPPAEISLASKFSRAMGPLQMFEVEAKTGQIILARGTITLHRT